MIAKPPQYSSYNRRRPKPVTTKKPATATLSRGVAVRPPSKPTLATPSLRKPSTPATSVRPAAPTPQARPTIAVPLAPPPQSMQSASDRTGAWEQYGLGVSNVNRALMEAAQRYGGVDSAAQFGVNDLTSSVGVTHNPQDNSALSVIQRNAAEASKNVDENAGADNTFFSTRRLGDLQNINSDADRQRIAAKAEYDAAVADYTSQVLGLRSSRNEGLRNADIADILAAQQNAPVNQIPQAAPAQAAAPAAKPKVVNNYRSPSGEVGTLHIYPDGRRVFVRR